MEHFISMAFWIFTLSCCLQSTPVPMSDAHISLLRENVKCLPNSTFYSPTNVKEQCIPTALDCFLKELHGPVQVECEDKNDYVPFTKEFLEILTEGHDLSDSPECACELSPELPFSEFLDTLESALQIYYIRHVKDKSHQLG